MRDTFKAKGTLITDMDYEKLEWIHFAIQEAQNGNLEELEKALELVEELREPYLAEQQEDE
jgi:hypothetical protein